MCSRITWKASFGEFLAQRAWGGTPEHAFLVGNQVMLCCCCFIPLNKGCLRSAVLSLGCTSAIMWDLLKIWMPGAQPLASWISLWRRRLTSVFSLPQWFWCPARAENARLKEQWYNFCLWNCLGAEPCWLEDSGPLAIAIVGFRDNYTKPLERLGLSKGAGFISPTASTWSSSASLYIIFSPLARFCLKKTYGTVVV